MSSHPLHTSRRSFRGGKCENANTSFSKPGWIFTPRCGRSNKPSLKSHAPAGFESYMSKVSPWSARGKCVFFHVCDSETTEPSRFQFLEKSAFGLSPRVETFNQKPVDLSSKLHKKRLRRETGFQPSLWQSLLMAL